MTISLPLTYMSIDDLAHQIQQHGQGTLLAKLDLESAFSHILVRPQDWELQGSIYLFTDSERHPTKYYFVNTVLPFGLRSSPKPFTDFAHASKLMMEYQGVSYVNQYLDDYVTVAQPHNDICQSNLNKILDLCDDIGLSLNPSNLLQPTTKLEFLGIIWIH